MSSLGLLENLTKGDFVYVDHAIVRVGKDWRDNFPIGFGDYGWNIYWDGNVNFKIDSFKLGIDLLLKQVWIFNTFNDLDKKYINEYLEYISKLNLT